MTIWKRDLDLIISNYSAKGHKEALPLLYRQLTWKLISPPPQSLGKLLLFLVSWQPQSYNRPTSVFFLTVGTAVSNIYTKRSKRSMHSPGNIRFPSFFLFPLFNWNQDSMAIEFTRPARPYKKEFGKRKQWRVKYCILSEALIHSNPSTA